MSIKLESGALWQKQPNAVWYTNIQPKCDLCRKKSDWVTEIKINEKDKGTRACFNGKRRCMFQAINLIFAQNPDAEFIWMRSILFEPVGKREKNKGLSKREPIGLSKRYTVMKRDGFQCVLCGVSGREALIEIDHILPLSVGGTDTIANLRTLCFKCNRGKRDRVE
jgi:hypothetical protein